MRREKMIKKFWSLLTVLIIATMVLSACATATTEAPAVTEAPVVTEAPATPVTVTIWHQWDGAYLTAIQAVFTQYMTEHPNVTIVLDKPENVTDALKVAIPAGEGPDILGWAVDNIGSQALVGNIIDLDSLGVTQDFLNSTYEPAAVKGVIWQGKIWALPESQEGIAIVYNKAVASEADFPNDPLDFADLLAKGKAYAEANPGKYLLCNQGLGNADAFHVAPVYFGFGVPGYVDDTGKVYLNTPEGIAAGNWIKEWKAYAPAETSHEICKTMITEGTAAAWWTGPWAIADLEAAGIDYGILPMGRPFVGVKTLMITKNAVDRGTAEVALDIMKYFTNQANETQVSLVNKTIPANTAALNDPQIQALATINGFGVALNLGIPASNSPYSSAQWGPVGDATNAIWSGAQTPEEALAAAQTAIETAIAGMQ
jgi:arabinogalactan oligomer/maltooligosaccharide transport system substrate-binding protein